uniref:Uncharacterized protein n=1 Tax=Malurus cyaneus samueli TaxID=2593467 RepID=A0A8C5U6C5_9PASS
MEPSPFNRRQWTSQSLKITAKELSLVNRNKSSALAERFSKKCFGELQLTPCSLQNAENLPAHFARGNLSVLKKKWENPALGAESGKEAVRSSCGEVKHKVGSSRATSPSPGAGTASGQAQCDSTEPRIHPRDSGTMENCVREPREMEKPEGSERSESPGRIEKYNVPLSKLKMMFEKGEAAQPKGPREPRRTAVGRRISENSVSSEDCDGERSHSTGDKAEARKNLDMPRLTETSIKDRLAKYQAAVSKQGSSSGITPMVSLGLCASEFLSQPETGKKILWKPVCSRVMPSFLEKQSVPIRLISDEELSLHIAGRNKYIFIFLEQY